MFNGYSSSLNASFSFEKLSRPFQLPKTGLPNPVRVVVALPVETPEVEPTPGLLVWGDVGVPPPIEDMDADEFLSPRIDGEPIVRSSIPDVTTENPGQKKPKKKQPQDDRPGVISGDEIDRQVVKFKVYNPDDAEQWVTVEAIKSIRFRLSDTDKRQTVTGKGKNIAVTTSNLSGKILKLNLRPPPPPPKPQT